MNDPKPLDIAQFGASDARLRVAISPPPLPGHYDAIVAALEARTQGRAGRAAMPQSGWLERGLTDALDRSAPARTRQGVR